MRSLLLFLISFLFLAIACKKEKVSEYYFKCKVDGKDFGLVNCSYCENAALAGDTIIFIESTRENQKISMFAFDSNIKETIYPLNHDRRDHDIVYQKSTSSFGGLYHPDSTRTGQLNIVTLDKTNKVVTGTFYCDVYDAAENKIVKITEGRFHLQYY